MCKLTIPTSMLEDKVRELGNNICRATDETPAMHCSPQPPILAQAKYSPGTAVSEP